MKYKYLLIFAGKLINACLLDLFEYSRRLVVLEMPHFAANMMQVWHNVRFNTLK